MAWRETLLGRLLSNVSPASKVRRREDVAPARKRGYFIELWLWLKMKSGCIRIVAAFVFSRNVLGLPTWPGERRCWEGFLATSLRRAKCGGGRTLRLRGKEVAFIELLLWLKIKSGCIRIVAAFVFSRNVLGWRT
jgi:hypothetical protein